MPFFVSIFILSPMFINNGTFTSAPVSNFANLLPLNESFFVSGDVFMTFRIIKLGGVTSITLLFQRVIVYSFFSFNHILLFPIISCETSYCS